MKITTKKIDNITIYHIIGSLDNNGAQDARDKIIPDITEDFNLILEMSKCNFISSAGLRTLLLTAKKLKTHLGKGVMVGVPEEISDVMEMTGFDDMFEVYKTLDAAVSALKGSTE
ncbi:MAG: STAS domain-containing protein [Spirochaetales bacterium]|nr:STAS domain-containing protein [Spirochaetales bacterium]